jgi:nitric oxide reductase NorE protein
MEINHKSLAYPPGGLLIWIVIYLELLTFGIAFAALAFYGSEIREEFHNDSQLLNREIATTNTILLLTSGFFVARAVQFFKTKNWQKTVQFLGWAMWPGLGFLVLKMIEYYSKIEAGIGMDYSTFYIFYWLLTAFHWIHVLVGLVILFVIRQTIIKKQNEASFEDLDAGAAFWHMCDLIWLILFPILYLIF